jgi:DNA-binding IclR family transcriptional regulator
MAERTRAGTGAGAAADADDAASRMTAVGSSFAKGLSVLSWVLDHEEARADTIAAELGLPLSSVYRYLRTLRDGGFVVDRAGAYGPGRRLGSRSRSLLPGSIGTTAAPFLRHLSSATGETAVLTIRQGLHAVCVRQVESPHEIRLAFRLGQLLPLYAGAGQRVLLAFAPDEVQRAVLDMECRALTPNTPTRAELTSLLGRIRADGFTISRGELIPGSVALGVPVLNGRHAIAGLCIAGPRNRCGPAWQAAARAELVSAAESIAATLTEEHSSPSE